MLTLTPRHVASPNRPKYLQISDEIRERIADGYLRPGENLPSEQAIADMVEVSKTVVRNALSVLEREGAIERRNGMPARITPEGQVRVLSPVRYFLEDDAIRMGAAAEGSAFTDGHGIAWDAYHVDTQIRREVATPKDTVLLQIPAGSYVWRRLMIKYAGGVPVEVQRSALPEFVVDGHEWLIEPGRQPVPGGTQRELADAGYRPRRILEVHRTRDATELEQRDLRIGPISVFDSERVFYAERTIGEDLVPVEASRLILPGPRHIIVYETELPAD
jgi:GntR family transcriptional regulator